MFLVTSPIVINVPTRGLLAVETMHAIVRWLANLNIKRNMTSMFVNKKHRYYDDCGTLFMYSIYFLVLLDCVGANMKNAATVISMKISLIRLNR